jgi:hypothetical protein
VHSRARVNVGSPEVRGLRMPGPDGSHGLADGVGRSPDVDKPVIGAQFPVEALRDLDRDPVIDFPERPDDVG